MCEILGVQREPEWDLSFEYFIANGSVEGDQQERATVMGEGMANLLPPYQLEGKGEEGRRAPPPFVPLGVQEPAAR